MRNRALAVVGIVVALAGAVFALQGVGLLGGSFMSGSATWLVIGLVLVAAGLTLYGRATRNR
jgi:hypothetical protein